jgi:dihydroxy-acid dehydratase
LSGASVGGVIGHISPKAALGGVIAIVEDGDIISYDVFKCTINLEVSQDIIEKRLKNWKCPPPKVKSGWLCRYAQMAMPVSEGATVKFDIEIE